MTTKTRLRSVMSLASPVVPVTSMRRLKIGALKVSTQMAPLVSTICSSLGSGWARSSGSGWGWREA